MFQSIVTSALVAGFCAGLVAAGLHLVFLQPVLLLAEAYEAGDAVHFGAATRAAVHAAPVLDVVRDGLTVVFFALTYVGWALLLVALMAFASDRGHAVTARNGLIWGLCGFIAVALAPAFGLAPELPGVAAADLTARQIWWFATIIATALALWLIAFGDGWGAWGAALVLLAAPHVIGAPVPAAFSGPAPPELGAEFAARALGIALASWTALGAIAGWLWSREKASV